MKKLNKGPHNPKSQLLPSSGTKVEAVRTSEEKQKRWRIDDFNKLSVKELGMSVKGTSMLSRATQRKGQCHQSMSNLCVCERLSMARMCERLSVTKLCVCVTKIVCDKDVCERLSVTEIQNQKQELHRKMWGKNLKKHLVEAALAQC